MRKLISVLAILFSLSTAYSAPVIVDSTSFLALKEKLSVVGKQRPTVALVLSGGGAKGACVPGILKYIEDKGVPVDVVFGVSIGALVGGLYCVGYTPESLDSLFASADWMKLMSDSVPRAILGQDRRFCKDKYTLNLSFNGKNEANGGLINGIPAGLIAGFNLYNLFSSKLVGYENPDEDFSSLPVPLVTVSTDINVPASVVMQKGDLISALRSSISMPYIFKPVYDGDKAFIDGGTLNNYPLDLARELGVDYIIGVDLSQEGEKMYGNSLVSFIFQNASGHGDLKYIENDGIADISVHPVLKNMTSISFSPDAIAAIRDAGYSEILEHDSEFDSLLIAVGGPCRREFSSLKAIDISKRGILLDSILFEGLREDEIRFWMRKTRLSAGVSYTSDAIEKAVSIVYGSGAFDEVSYRILGKDEPYKLIIKCVRAKSHTLSIGLGVDTESALAASAKLSLWQNSLFDSKLDLATRLGTSPYIQLRYRYQLPAGFGFGMSLKASFNSVKGFDPRDAAMNYRRNFEANEASVFLCNGSMSPVAFEAGARLMHTPYVKTFSLGNSFLIKDAGMFGAVAFAGIGFDSLDDAYFPSKGVAARLKYDFLFAGQGISPSHYPSLSFKAAIPISSRLALIPELGARARLGGTGQLFFMDNYAGGRIDGRYFDSQISFFGVNGVRNCDDILGVGQLAFRFNPLKSLYASLKASVLCDGNAVSGMNKAVWSAGIEVGYKSLLGPVFANIGWNSETKSVCGYFGFGFAF